MMVSSTAVLFLPLIYIWGVHGLSAYFGHINAYPIENVDLFASGVSDIQQHTFAASNRVAFPSSQGSTDHHIKVHSYDTATPPLAVDYNDITEAFYQALKWPSAYYKKPTKYFKHHALTGLKLKHASKANNVYYHKNCCQDRWPMLLLTNKNVDAAYKLMQQPLGPTYYPGNQDYGYRPVDDVKPVVEHIEGDLKYDFRTGKHSF